MRILIATVQVPFIRGGAEIHAEGLRDALRRAIPVNSGGARQTLRRFAADARMVVVKHENPFVIRVLPPADALVSRTEVTIRDVFGLFFFPVR